MQQTEHLQQGDMQQTEHLQQTDISIVHKCTNLVVTDWNMIEAALIDALDSNPLSYLMLSYTKCKATQPVPIVSHLITLISAYSALVFNPEMPFAQPNSLALLLLDNAVSRDYFQLLASCDSFENILSVTCKFLMSEIRSRPYVDCYNALAFLCSFKNAVLHVLLLI